MTEIYAQAIKEMAMKRSNPRKGSSHVTGFLNGTSDHAYAFMGAHPVQQDGQSGWFFRVWAPHAVSVAVAGSFNQWSKEAHVMQQTEGGIWELFIPGLQIYDSYKYVIQTEDGRTLYKSDPYAFHTETRPANASKLYNIEGYQWGDEHWLQYRTRRCIHNRPLNIYEVHLGSWRRNQAGQFLSYRDVAGWLVPYLKEMGFTAVKFLPLTEHPLDESWGYQCTGYFAPTSRFRTPHDFMHLVDQLHQAGIIVIMDWTPSCFPQDEYALASFDGKACYEPEDPQEAILPKQGTCVFNFERSEVRSFLTSSALFWLEKYHLDGIRLGGVSSMVYLDYEDRPYKPNSKGGRENLAAVDFLRHLNDTVHARYPYALMMSEGSTAWPFVTRPTSEDPAALGFSFKCALGWMSDTLHYLQLDPIYRQYNQKDLTFSLSYANSERFLLPLSHDVAARRSFISRLKGDDTQKFDCARAFYLYMLTHPGKKLLMMGTEFGQFGPWRSEYSLDWHLLDYQPFRQHQAFFRSANQFYLEQSPLWELDHDPAGFQWIYNDANSNILTFLRRDKSGQQLLVAISFSPVGRAAYRIGVPTPGSWQVLFHSDSTAFGGCGRVDGRPIQSSAIPCHQQEDSIVVDLPPLTGLVLRCVQIKAHRPASKKEKGR